MRWFCYGYAAGVVLLVGLGAATAYRGKDWLRECRR